MLELVNPVAHADKMPHARKDRNSNPRLGVGLVDIKGSELEE
eukprot:CAMPEP_0119466288 /NCGR_PEP_ID=MMETSP1344-20130328/1015_1 /TAXON_ID=236787 /ORGANISM="Florenciella parvula, Strain CCMP2471" /LENGTH=41 /DNA_ID= /DNA_START= /DNA_END= /DNA_ORIENTATION=